MCRTPPPKADRALKENSEPRELRDVLGTGAAEDGKTWISQARKLNPAQGEGKKPHFQREIPAPAVPCSATSSVWAYSLKQRHFH